MKLFLLVLGALFVCSTQAAQAATLDFQAATSSVTEGGAAHAIPVVLSTDGATLVAPVSVSVAIGGPGSATNFQDYILSTPSVVFPAGSADGTSLVVILDVLDDTLVENEETLTLSLGILAGPAALGTQESHGVTITDNEFATVAFQAASSSVNESDAKHTVPVVLSTAGAILAVPVTAQVTFDGSGSATSGDDFINFGVVTVFFPSSTQDGITNSVVLTVVDDALIEETETVNLALFNVTGPAVSSTPVIHTVNILDDESAEAVPGLGAVQLATLTALLLGIGLTLRRRHR